MEISQHARTFDVVIEWVDDWPAEIRESVEPYVQEMVDLLPNWVHVLYLRWDSTDADNVAKTYTSSRNRWAKISVCPQWLDETPEERLKSLRHEVLHVYLDRMGDACRKAIKQLEDEGAREIANQWFYDAEEEAVTDLAHMIGKAVAGRSRWEDIVGNIDKLRADSRTAIEGL